MSYPRINTVQVANVSASDAAVTVTLPNSTSVLPTGQSGSIFPIGADHRWRIHAIVASYSATGIGELTITDGTFTWTVDVTGTLVIPQLDLQCGGGAAVTLTLGALTGAVGHLNVSAISE